MDATSFSSPSTTRRARRCRSSVRWTAASSTPAVRFPWARVHERGDPNGCASARPPMVRRGTAGPPSLRHRGGGLGHTPVRRRGPDPVRRSGARRALCAELSTRSHDDADLLSLSAIAAQAGITIQRLRVTEQMALEHERHASELEAVLATMHDALLIVDARGAIVRLNRAARELSAWTARASCSASRSSSSASSAGR